MKKIHTLFPLFFVLLLASACVGQPATPDTQTENTVLEEEQQKPVTTEEINDSDDTSQAETDDDDAIEEQDDSSDSEKEVSEEASEPSGDANSEKSSNTSETQPSDTTSPTTKSFSMTAKNWEFSPSTITVKKGDKVKLTIKSVDVDHGFSLPDFGVNVKLEPGKTVTTEFVADKQGTFQYRCSVQCGSGHKEMTGTLIVE